MIYSIRTLALTQVLMVTIQFDVKLVLVRLGSRSHELFNLLNSTFIKMMKIVLVLNNRLLK